jgi:hypothetical protein
MAKLSKKQIERQIRERALNTANILLTDHARKRMRERRITLAMVYDVLRKGMLVREPEPSLRHEALECRMERYVEGRDIGVVVAFEIAAAGLPVITVMDI